MKGWLIDVIPDYNKNKIVLWIKGVDGKTRKIYDKHNPCFYIYSREENLEYIMRDFEYFLGVESIDYVEKIIQLGEDVRKVLKISIYDYKILQELIWEIRAKGRHNEYELFNVDVDLALSYLVDKNLFPMAFIDIDELAVIDNIHAVDYETPSLSKSEIDVNIKENELKDIKIDNTEINGDEKNLLENLLIELNDANPDILITDGGDVFLPFMYRKAEEYGLDFTLGREKEIVPFGNERIYFSYGRVIYSPPKCMLNGRIHIDRANSFFYRKSGLDGLIEISRLSRIPVQKLSRLTPGTAITAMQIAEALKQDVVIKWKKNTPEKIKDARTLFLADRGGMIYELQVGIHEDVYEIDFTSMYPHIMMKYNISPETVLCECCQYSKLRVPVLDYNICERRIGLIPKVLEPLVRRRVEYKKRLQKESNEMYVNRKNALKWILVTCFGYTGYRNARFGRIECHEAINAFAREILVESAHIAEEHGFEVIHGIVDSLWLKGEGDISLVCGQIDEEIGIPLELEGKYKWIVFLPNKGNKSASLNHYYGLMDNGKIKVRGLEVRRRDMPLLVKECQTEILQFLSEAGNIPEFMELIPNSLDILKKYVKRIKSGDCSLDELLFTKRVTRSKDEYLQLNNNAACILQLNDAGVEVKPGENIQYIIKDSSSNKYYRKVKAKSNCQETESYDKEKYISYLCKSVDSMFLPFGYNEKVVRNRVTGLTMLPLVRG